MALPSFSFGAEGVEYGRSSAYYATTTGDEDFPNDVLIQGNLTVGGLSSLNGVVASGNLTLTGGTPGTGRALVSNGIYGADLVSAPTFPNGLTSVGTSSLAVLNGLGATVPGNNDFGVQNTMVIAGYRVSWGVINAGVGANAPFLATGVLTLTTPLNAATVIPTIQSSTTVAAISVGMIPDGGTPSTTFAWQASSGANNVLFGLPVYVNWMIIGRA